MGPLNMYSHAQKASQTSLQWVSVQKSALRQQGFPDEAIIKACAAYDELHSSKFLGMRVEAKPLTRKLFADSKEYTIDLGNSATVKKYPKCVDFITYLKQQGQVVPDDFEGSFSVEDTKAQSVSYKKYVKAVSLINTNVWHFNNKSLLPYPDSSAKDPKNLADAQAIRAYTDSYNTTLADVLGKVEDVKGVKGGVIEAKRNADAAIRNITAKTDATGKAHAEDCIKMAQDLLALKAENYSLDQNSINQINAKLALIGRLDQQELLKFVYGVVNYQSVYNYVYEWLITGSDMGEGFTSQQLEYLAIQAYNSGAARGLNSNFVMKAEQAKADSENKAMGE